MVHARKLNSALFALNTVIVLAREMAYDERPCKELAGVLDVAEFLPRLLAETEDRTSDFREYLCHLSMMNGRFNLALERFDRDAPSKW